MPPKLKRQGTMQETAAAGKAIAGDAIEASGRSSQRETRSRAKARDALSTMAPPAKKGAGKKAAATDAEVDAEKARLRLVFRVFDRDGNGAIDPNELAAVMRSMGRRPLKRKIKQIFAEADADKSGTIDAGEFVDYMLAKKFELGDDGDDDDDDDDDDSDQAAAGLAAVTALPSAVADKAKEAAAKTADDKTPPTAAPAAGADKKRKRAAPAPLARGASVVDYYNTSAGAAGTSADDSSFDLGRDGAFDAFTVLIGELGEIDKEAWPKAARDGLDEALKTKGVKVIHASGADQFCDVLSHAHVAWLICGQEGFPRDDRLLSGISNFHNCGGGIAIFADSEECRSAGQLLREIFKMSLGAAEKRAGAKKPADHLLTAGIETVEATSGCALDGTGAAWAAITDGVVALPSGASSMGSGRVVVDASLGKLAMAGAGHRRLLLNTAVWLLGVEYKLATASVARPLIAAVPEHEGAQYVWQYYLEHPQDGKPAGWHPYDSEANGIVDGAYADWCKSPYIDVRAVKSGRWTYSIDFNTLKQTNIEHPAHRVRFIRRVKV